MRPNPAPSLFLLATLVSSACAQTADSPGNLKVSGKVGGKSYDVAGSGNCRHTPDASIYGVPAALWMVQHSSDRKGGIEQLNLTLWRPKDGSREQISLSLAMGSKTSRIDVGGRGDQVGTAKATVTPKGAGGRFEVKGSDGEGNKVELTITCPTFAPVEAEGG